MAASNQNRASYWNYPFLRESEFAEVCHYLDSKYMQATLGPLRRVWRLHVHTAFDTSAMSHELVTFVQITKPLEDGQVDEDLASQLSNVVLDSQQDRRIRRSRRIRRNQEESDGDRVMINMEEADKEALTPSPGRPIRARFQSGHVVYEIHRHPVYQAPCLWFSLHNLPIDESPLDLDTVIRRLVPDQFKQMLSNQGGIGGISIEHHPITGVPTFFVHPCFLAEAMADLDCSKENYLMAWIGLAGACVGLCVPKEMAMHQA